MRNLTTYTTDELTDLRAQGYAILPSLGIQAQHEMIDLIASIQNERDSRLVWLKSSIVARVCGYADDGSLLPAVENHLFPRVTRSSRR